VRLLHFFSSVMSIAVRTRSSPLALVEPLQRQLRGAAYDQTLYDVHTMEQLVGASLARQRFLSLVFAIFAGLALSLAAIGVYGMLAYLTGQRTSEIGLRMALGASVRQILRLVVWQGMKLTLVGVAVGGVATVAVAQTLHHLVEGMQPAGVFTYLIVIPLLPIAALLAAFIPARRASLVDPVKALRQE
jgi:ABC-type antimicrobial peptide transport system permease subunit